MPFESGKTPQGARPYKKGQSGNPAGRPKGVKNEKTLQWEQLGHALITNHAERANQILAKCDDQDFMQHFGKLLEYFKPKLQRSEVQQSGEITVNQSMIIGGQKIVF